MNTNQVGIEGETGSGGGSGDHHDQDYSAIEILNDYAMESVLSFLPMSDLKQCRLVNHLWNQSTLRGITAKPHTIVFPVIPDRNGNRQDNCKIEDIPELITLITNSFQFPWTKFKVDARILKSSFDKKAMVGLFKVISPFVTELAIDNLFNQPLYPGRIDKQFETLKILKLHYCPSESVIPQEMDLGFVFGLLEIAPCLDMLWLKGYQWIDHFIQILGTSTGRKITRLYLSSMIEGKHLTSLGELGLNLKYLCLDLSIMNFFKMNLDPEDLRSFLESLSTSLEELDLKSGLVDITNSLITQVKVEFPRMTKLKVLKICPASQYLKINFASQFPTLRKLEFTVGNPFLINMRSYFNLGMKPLETVQELVFHEDMTDPEIVVLAGRQFPRLKKICVKADRDLLEGVDQFMLKVKELKLLLVAEPPVSRNRLVGDQELGYLLGLSFIKNIKTLKLEALKNTELKITNVSCDFLLNKWEQLQIVELMGELTTATISDQVLENMQERLVVRLPMQD